MKFFDVESAVRQRYSAAASRKVEALCCPIDYDRQFLKVIPPQILERDYGCGDPSRYLHPGETVLDLGSGAGKICFIASQVVGPKGRVIGVDMNDEMLALARKHQPAVAQAVGWDNVIFRKGRIQDLALDLEALDEELKARPIAGVNSFLEAQSLAARLRLTQPLVPDDSIDVVVSSCVLNLVEAGEKAGLFGEIFRVLRSGGRAVISDIVSDHVVPEELQKDPELWSGCISGALTEEGFLAAFVAAGFHGLRILKLDPNPWRTVRGLEFRSMTVEAWKGDSDPEGDGRFAAIYKGPFREVLDDGGRRFARGRRHAVTEQAAVRLRTAPYREHFDVLDPRVSVTASETEPIPSDEVSARMLGESNGRVDMANSSGGGCGERKGCC